MTGIFSDSTKDMQQLMGWEVDASITFYLFLEIFAKQIYFLDKHKNWCELKSMWWEVNVHLFFL